MKILAVSHNFADCLKEERLVRIENSINNPLAQAYWDLRHDLRQPGMRRTDLLSLNWRAQHDIKSVWGVCEENSSV
jgi:hypothetical protein